MTQLVRMAVPPFCYSSDTVYLVNDDTVPGEGIEPSDIVHRATTLSATKIGTY